ncbi:MAG TPA: GTP 3',8-cyclase MoaA [Tepidisphaeraceae bacterium]|nr:GTP 3',8-cyclase MoaA [Tepidisphaeraceae bacterium]
MRLAVLDRPLALPNADGPRSIEAVRVLRISLTDRCNYRCLYCMPEEGVRWLPREELLCRNEIVDVARAALEVHGITRFKLTGGEPTVRPDLVELVAELSRLDGIDDLSMTTNGQLLADLAVPLKEAGLNRLTVSIDSLRPARFRQITRTGDLAAVMRGLDAAEQARLESIKINCVTMRGVNDDEFAEFASLTLDRHLTVRFIEYMPLGEAALIEESGPAVGCGGQDRGADSLVPEEEVRATIESALGPLMPVRRDLEAGVGPANVYRLANARGRIGFISSMSAPFCATCNRLRLTADGLLRSCLFDGGEVDVKPILRGDHPHRQRELARAMVDCVRLKPVVHSHHGNKQMSRIGG